MTPIAVVGHRCDAVGAFELIADSILTRARSEGAQMVLVNGNAIYAMPAESRRANAAAERSPHRLVGVYTQRAPYTQIAHDLAMTFREQVAA